MSAPVQDLALKGARLRREEAVGPYLERIAADGATETEGAGAGGSRIAVGGRLIDLTHWEWSVLVKGFRQRAGDEAREPAIDGWPERLAEGVAFQARYLTHVARIQDGPAPAPGELDAFREELITDAALGLALQEELQRDVDNLVVLGELDPAKKLTAFRHKIGQSLGRLKEMIGEEGFRRAEATAAELTAPAPRQTRAPLLEEEAEAPAQFRRDAGYGAVQHLQVKAPGRARLLALLLAACFVAAAVFHLALRRVPGPPMLPAATFAGMDGVHDVLVRPPSLFVTVDEARWREMAPAEREALVEQVGQIADRSGYSGAHFRTPTGLAVRGPLARTQRRACARRAVARRRTELSPPRPVTRSAEPRSG
jgi:hypothetical protein